MKPTGIVRRIDDLGRIVIPKEIRRALKIKDGDPLEIYTARDGSVIIKPYHKDWEICILEWHNNNRERLNHPSHKYHEMGDFTICVLNDNRIGTAKWNHKDIRDYRIGKTIAYFHALGYDDARIDKEIGYEG